MDTRMRNGILTLVSAALALVPVPGQGAASQLYSLYVGRIHRTVRPICLSDAQAEDNFGVGIEISSSAIGTTVTDNEAKVRSRQGLCSEERKCFFASDFKDLA